MSYLEASNRINSHGTGLKRDLSPKTKLIATATKQTNSVVIPRKAGI
jgi:hypothetical protein